MSWIKKYKINVLMQEICLAAVVLGLGIFIGIVYEARNLLPETTGGEMTLLNLLFYFLLITLLIIVLLKFTKGKVIFRLLFALAIFGGLQIVFSLWLSTFWSILLAALLVFFRYLYPLVWLHNLLMTLALAGIGALLGLSFAPLAAIIILLILSVYDIIAVLVTKHMVTMARGLLKRGVFLALLVPEKISLWKSELGRVQAGGQAMILGGGDLALPLILVDAVLIAGGIGRAVLTAGGCLLGVCLDHYFFISEKPRRPIPALPLITFGAIGGFLISLMIF